MDDALLYFVVFGIACLLIYNIYGHFNVHLLLEHPQNVVTLVNVLYGHVFYPNNRLISRDQQLYTFYEKL